MTKPTENKSQDTTHDDLTRIKGIGEVTQQWLRDTFAVRTYRDLVMVTPADIEERLKAEGKITARSKIDEWLVQARILASSSEPPARLKNTAKANQDIWKTFSTFVVMFEEQQSQGETCFQTKAHHMEADNTQAWPGISPAELIQWILTQLGPRGAQALAPQATPQIPEQMEFSNKLRHYAAKAQILSGEQRSQLPVEALQQAPAQSEPIEAASPTPAVYSDKLQQLIMKARRLTRDS